MSDVVEMIVEAIQKEHESFHAKVISQVNGVVANHIPLQVDSFLRDYMSNNILHVHLTQSIKANAQDLQSQLYLMMRDDKQLFNADLAIWLSLKIKFEQITTTTACRPFATPLRDHDDYQDDDARSGTQEKLDEFDTWMEDVGTNDDEVPDDKVLQELLEEMLGVIDEAKL
nr:hypothetical protein [Tanacetum cinerariifolium]